MGRLQFKGLRIGWGPVSAEMRLNRSERELLHPLFVVLGDRRALRVSAAAGIDADEAYRSIEDVRADLRFALKELGPDAAVSSVLEELRQCCRDYLHAADKARRNGGVHDFTDALQRLQAPFRTIVDAIATDYDLPSARELAYGMKQESDLAAAAGQTRKPADSKVGAEDRTLWSIEQLAALEQMIDVQTIWIVGRDFSTDLSGGSFHDVIRQNAIHRGIKYAYVAPDTHPARRQLATLTSALRLPDPSSVEVFLLGAERWDELPYTFGNFTVYDPLRRQGSPVGFCWYPGGDGDVFGRLADYVVANWVNVTLAVCPPLEFT